VREFLRRHPWVLVVAALVLFTAATLTMLVIAELNPPTMCVG